MKLETLNIWGGRVKEPLLDHVEEQRQEVDIFCFQEVFSGRLNTKTFSGADIDIYSRLAERLSGFQGRFYRQENMGLAIFARDSIVIDSEGELFVHRWRDAMENDDPSTMGKNLCYMQFQNGDKQTTVVNFHGLWNGKGKTDAPERLEQARKVKAFLDSIVGAKIICGDFNMNPDTESLGIIGEGMRNLIVEHGVTSTRSELYEKPGRFADYILTSQEVVVVDFRVLQVPVSDHLPLQLEFN